MMKPSTNAAVQIAQNISRFMHWLGWSRASLYLLSAFFLTIALIIYIWWPLAQEYLALVDWEGEWWRYIDWLLVNIFLVMSLLIISRADLRRDGLVILVGLAGGLVIESWGTQTELWTYYTAERPPLWIIPAWPIASLSIDRLVQVLQALAKALFGAAWQHRLSWLYWPTFLVFIGLMLVFVAPTLDKSFTILALLLSAGLILIPGERALAWLTFLAGSGLGYYLELWGTTRECWTYYTYETPPLFAILAHGMAAVAFWRAGQILTLLLGILRTARRESGLSGLRSFARLLPGSQSDGEKP